MQNQDIRRNQHYAHFEILRFILLGVNFGPELSYQLLFRIHRNSDTVTEN